MNTQLYITFLLVVALTTATILPAEAQQFNLSKSIGNDQETSLSSRRRGPSPLVEFYSGYGRTLFDLEYHEQTGYIPAGVRGFIPVNDLVYVGGELKFNLYSPTFLLKNPFTDEVGITEKYRGNYLGVLGRVVFYEDRDVRLFAQGGIGANVNNRIRYIYSDLYVDNEHLADSKETVYYKTTFGFNVGAGCALGDEIRFVPAIVYSYRRFADKNDDEVFFNTSMIGIQLGVSLSQ